MPFFIPSIINSFLKLMLPSDEQANKIYNAASLLKIGYVQFKLSNLIQNFVNCFKSEILNFLTMEKINLS